MTPHYRQPQPHPQCGKCIALYVSGSAVLFTTALAVDAYAPPLPVSWIAIGLELWGCFRLATAVGVAHWHGHLGTR